MKIRLRKDLPDYPAGTTFRQDGSIWELDSTHSTGKALPICLPDWVQSFVMSNWDNSDWFERIDETPLYWEPKFKEEYWYVEDNGAFIREEYTENPADDLRLAIGNAFPTKEAAQAHVEYLKALTNIRRYVTEQGLEVFNDHEEAWSIVLDTSRGGAFIPLFMPISVLYSEVLPSFPARQDAIQVINERHDDLKTIFGVEE